MRMKCKICGSNELKGDCQYINGNYYHNYCIEKLQKENKELHNKIDKLEDELEWYKQECDDLNKKVVMRRNNMKKARTELSLMKRKNDFSNINMVIAMLNTGRDDEE